jgi:hypothetical protein
MSPQIRCMQRRAAAMHWRLPGPTGRTGAAEDCAELAWRVGQLQEVLVLIARTTRLRRDLP